MNIHIVRLQKNKEIVGIFVSRDRDELWFLTDQVTDPGECEFASLPRGGIMWPGPNCTKIVPPEDGDEDWNPKSFSGAEFDEYWLEAVYFKKLRWKQFDEKDFQRFYKSLTEA